MANRNFRRDIASPDQGLVSIAGQISITGSTGATTADTLTYASASNLSAGVYRVFFEDFFVSLKHASFTIQNTGSQDLTVVLSGSNLAGILSGSSGSNGITWTRTTLPCVDFFVRSGSANTKPSNDMSIFAHFLFKNSSV